MNLEMRFPGGKQKTLTFSYDDGAVFDKRLSDIFTSRGLKATFNINSSRFNGSDGKDYLTWEQAKQCYIDAGHEVALHTLTHPYLEMLRANDVLTELIEDKRAIEEKLGVIVRGMAYPFGCYNEDTLSAMRLLNIAYSRGTNSTERFNMPKNWPQLDPTCHHDNPHLFELAESFTSAGAAWGRCEMFYVWGHSYEFDRNNNWDRIERFADMVCHNDNIWYATNIEIYDYVKAFEALHTSFDNKIVHNPSALEVWFGYNGKLYSVKPGETIKLD